MENVSSEVVEIAESLAKRYMKGFRDGSERPSWRHPEDVARLVGEVPGVPSGACRYLKAVAWLHDVLEDTKVGEEGLAAAGIPSGVIEGVKALTKEKGAAPNAYYEGLARSPEWVRIVKCCDRIANLREGRSVFQPKRWKAYLRETERFVLPLALSLDPVCAGWLKRELEAAAGVEFGI